MRSRAAKVAIWTRRLAKKPSACMNKAAARARGRASKAASISLAVPALRTETSSASARAASCTARKVMSMATPVPGLTRTANRDALGTNSCRSPNCFDATSKAKKLEPVALPPGRARLLTRPSSTGSTAEPKTIGIVDVAVFAASAASVLPGVAIGDLTADKIRDHRRNAIVPALHPVVLDRDIPAFNEACFAQALAECGQITRCGIGRSAVDE